MTLTPEQEIWLRESSLTSEAIVREVYRERGNVIASIWLRENTLSCFTAGASGIGHDAALALLFDTYEAFENRWSGGNNIINILRPPMPAPIEPLPPTVERRWHPIARSTAWGMWAGLVAWATYGGLSGIFQ